MEEYSLIFDASTEDFEQELRDIVKNTREQVTNRFFVVERISIYEPDVLPIFMLVHYPGETVPGPKGFHELEDSEGRELDTPRWVDFDWGPQLRSEQVPAAIRCRIFKHGKEKIRVSIEVADERAHEYCALLVQRLDWRWPGSRQRTPETEQGKGQAWATGKVSDETAEQPTPAAAEAKQAADPLAVINNAAHRDWVRQWNEGHSRTEIAEYFHVSPGTVGNIMTLLRKKHGTNVVIYHT